MNERLQNELAPGQLFPVIKKGSSRAFMMRIHAVSEDEEGVQRVIASPFRSRTQGCIIPVDVLRQGGTIEVGGRLKAIIIPPKLGRNVGA
jgi:hypothetical protein